MRYLLLIGCLLGLAFAAQAQTMGTSEFSIEVLNVREGLLSNFVTKVIADEHNLKYFATEGGVSKFDGYEFTEYRPNTHPGLENENIETLFRDRDNLIWIGTKGGGLSVMDTRTDSIRSMNHLFADLTSRKLRVISLNQDGNGNIWVGTWGNGLFVVDPKAGKLVNHIKGNQPIYNIIRDQYHNMWFLSGWELLKYDPSEARLIRFNTGNVCYNLVEDRQRNKIWIIGNNLKKVVLSQFDYEDQQVRSQVLDLEARFVQSLALDGQNRLWLGSWGDGLYISDSTVTSFRRVNTNPDGGDLENVNYSMIVSINIDENGIAWLTTAYGGVLILYPNKGFEVERNVTQTRISDHNITAFYKDRDGVSYKGTLAAGLYWNRDSAGYTALPAIGNQKIHCLYERDERLFVGTANGLFIVQNKDFGRAKQLFAGQKITAVCLDRQQRLWVGTQQSGLKMSPYSPQEKDWNAWTVFSENSATHPLDNDRISEIGEDAEGHIWLGTYSGLNRYDDTSGQILNQDALLGKQLPLLIVNDLHLSGQLLYLGTPTGLVALQLQAGKPTLQAMYHKQAGLTNDFICAIEEDPQGRLWLSTTTTISCFHPDRQTFTHYDREDGVMIHSFHLGSSFQDTDGRIYFGGSNGLISFDPAHISQAFRVPDVVLTRLTVNNRALQVGDEVDGEIILQNTIQNTEQIELGYSQNHLSLSFAVNDFLGPDHVHYAYQLKGLSDEWVALGPTNQISFTGLRRGEYELRVRASRNNQDWGPEKTLRIYIASPPWLSAPAFVAYCVFLIALLFLIRYISSRQARLRAELRIVQIEKEKEHELNEAKITFFTNISHEFRTPLTLIISPVTELLGDAGLKESAKEKLLLVESNGKRMLRLINQLLDYRKSEHGLLKLNLTRSEFVGFAHEVFLSFKNMAISKKVAYTFHTEVAELTLDFDRNQMEIVLCNLLSNAFKYTPENGQVAMQLGIREESLFVEISDNGIGMSQEEAAKIFDRFYQVQNAVTANMVGSGIGLTFSKNIVDLHKGKILVDSTPGKGTVMSIRLPLAQTGMATEIAKRTADGQSAIWDEFALESQHALKWEGSNKSATVLIADDNEDIRTYLRSLLSEEYDVLEAADGQEALELLNRELPDLLISDVMMPKMDGIKLCHEVKNNIGTSHIPVILLTARSSMAYEMEGLKGGAEDYITKPFNPGIVQTRVKNILENRKKLREYYLNKVRFEPDSQVVAENDLDAQFIEKAINLVNENIQNEAFGIETMVDQLFMSQSTLFRKIKSLTGLSITAFIRSVKLKKAAQLILQSDMKLSQVSFEVGFNDYKHFKKSFQQQFGCLPSEYKSKMQQKAVNE